MNLIDASLVAINGEAGYFGLYDARVVGVELSDNGTTLRVEMKWPQQLNDGSLQVLASIRATLMQRLALRLPFDHVVIGITPD